MEVFGLAERQVRHLMDECKFGVVSFNRSMAELRTTLSAMKKKDKPGLTIIAGGKAAPK